MKDLFEKLQESSEKQFQKMFTKLMKKKYGCNYQEIQTYGNKGDRACDGLLNRNIAFAIYAPEIYKDDYALTKIKSDYRSFKKQRQNGYWQSVTELRFLIKTGRVGVTADVINLIAGLNFKNNEINMIPWTMDDIYREVEEFIVPKISYKVISDLCANINFLKKEYERLRNVYIKLGKNSNLLFQDGMQENGIQWYNNFVDIFNSNQNIYNIRFQYYNYFDDLHLGKYIDKLIELKPAFYNGDMITIYDGFEMLVDDKKYNKIKKLCNKILDGLNNKNIVS